MKVNKRVLIALVSSVLILACTGCEFSSTSSIPGKSEDMVTMLKELDTNSNASVESIIKTNISNEFESETIESEKLMMQLCPAYATMKSLGAKQSLVDTKINMLMNKSGDNKQVKVELGDTALEFIMDKDSSYMTKESFIKLMRATQENYNEIQNELDTVLNNYDWVKAPLTEASSFTLFEVPDGKPDKIFKNVKYTSTNDNNTGKVKKYEAELVTDKMKDIYTQIGLSDEILDNISIKVSIEHHEKDNTYYTSQVTKVNNYLEIVVNSKYKFENIKIKVPKDKIFDDTVENEQAEIKESKKTKEPIVRTEEKLSETETEVSYSANLTRVTNPVMTLSKTDDTQSFENYFKSKANEINNTVKTLGDFESKEPELRDEYGSLFYSRHDNGTSSSFNYYMSK